LSCPGLTRASTTYGFAMNKGVDRRDRPGPAMTVE
jgi:hypothetical protein